MKKYRYLATAFFSLLTLLTGSCKKSFLDVTPKGKLVAVNYEDYNKLMNSSSLYMLGGTNAGVWEAAAIMGDEVAAENYAYNVTSTGYPEAQALFQWADNVFPLNDLPNDYGGSNPLFMLRMLNNIYTFNKVIAEVPGVADGTAQQKLELQSEAMAERAFTNFQLVNYFTKPYNAATAATDPGFPVITIPSVQGQTFTRGTVQQSYDFMISDLTKAIPDLLIEPNIQTRVSKSAAEALLGKIYLFMGKNNEALAMFKNAFNDMAKMNKPPVLYDYNQAMQPDGAFQPFSPQFGPNSPFTNVTDVKESLWAVFTYAGPYNYSAFPTDFLTLTEKTTDLFDPTDWRLKFYTNLQADQATPIPGGRLHRNNLVWARIGIELPDLYLLKAEAEARAGDLPAAKTDVETLRKMRMPLAVSAVPASASANQNALIKFIIQERTREFATEGARWFDMRRLFSDPLFSGQPAAQHILYKDATNSTIYTLKPERLTLRFPPIYLSQTPGITDNP